MKQICVSILKTANESNQQKTDRMVLDLQSQVTTLNKEWIETKEKYAAASVNNISSFL